MAVCENWKVSFPSWHWNCLPIWDVSIMKSHCCVLPAAVVNERQKSQEKRKRDLKIFSYFKRRTGNLKSIFPVSRREIEIKQNIMNFREEKGICFAQALRRETEISPILKGEREYCHWNYFTLFWEQNSKGSGKPRVISLRKFLELKTVAKVWSVKIIGTTNECS